MEETVEKNLNFNDRISVGFQYCFYMMMVFFNHEIMVS